MAGENLKELLHALSAGWTDPGQRKRLLEGAASAALIVLMYAVMFMMGITCPLKFMTGVSCAGCGMTRAWLHLMQSDVRGALYYHPLFWLPPVALAVIVLRSRMNPRLYRGLMACFVIMFLAVYAYRMLFGVGDIVVFEPENGVIRRGIRFLVSVLQ